MVGVLRRGEAERSIGYAEERSELQATPKIASGNRICPARGPMRALLLATSLWCLISTEALAQRTLHWQELAVSARLDAEGRLHVVERHAVVMSGDWNGGERFFNLNMGQPFRFLGVRRIDPDTGMVRDLPRGSLSTVDTWNLRGRALVRWRSRLPEDPPFAETVLIHELTYELDEVVRARDGGFLLDHDFAFPDRVGSIERFGLELTLDPAWKPRATLPHQMEAQALAPGESFPVTALFDYRGPGSPSRALAVPAQWPVWLTWLLGVVGTVWLYRRFLEGERPLGRLAPPLSHREVDEAWLETDLFPWLPEQVGAIWDQKVGPPEVAAVLARLVAEGKLESRIEKRGWFGRKVMVLDRKVPLAELDGYVGRLVRKLFFDKRRTVDSDALREHYKKRGLNPAAILQSSLTRAIGSVSKRRRMPPLPVKPWVLILAGFALVLIDPLLRTKRVVADLGDGVTDVRVVWILLVGLFAALGAIFGGLLARRVEVHLASVQRLAIWLPVMALGALSSFGLLQLFARHNVYFGLTAGPVGLAGVTLLTLGLLAFWLKLARAQLDKRGIEVRRRLAAIRAWFAHELRQKEPRLDDAWFPYLLALGLAGPVERWFRAFGGADSGGLAGSGAFGSTTASAGSRSATSWTGGGGAFGGGGATASWAATAAGIASGVSRGGSGSGSSSSSGGSSSSTGGGGGGGW